MTKGKMINQFLRAFKKLKGLEDHYNIVAGPELKRVRFYLTNLYRSFCAYNRGEVPFYFVQINLDIWNDEGRPMLRKVLDDWHNRPQFTDYVMMVNADDAYNHFIRSGSYEQAKKNALAASLVAYMNQGGSLH